ncbi:hypothetical protein J6590_007874 [Homalodisca vitripennis]|nr:hypothetical protein J6590_007874 [Homalodisca vitripennis]
MDRVLPSEGRGLRFESCRADHNLIVIGDCSSVGRALDCGSSCRGFKSHHKKIILGIGGGIAAYKAPEIVRRLRELGAEVRVVMTSAAKAFITPLSLQVVSSNYVANEMLDQSYQAAMKHIQLAKWADFVILAPATADLLARLAAGFANDLLSAICLATPATIAAVPAMNQHMYLAAATQANLTTLRKRGILLWGPDNGSQACGDIGLGRMLDPLVLVEQVRSYFLTSYSLTHLKIMITAGPTREELDPVRFISNYSSGKMGFAIAYAAAARGAQVTLIAGPVNANTPPGVKQDRIRLLERILLLTLGFPMKGVTQVSERELRNKFQSGIFLTGFTRYTA